VKGRVSHGFPADKREKFGFANEVGSGELATIPGEGSLTEKRVERPWVRPVLALALARDASEKKLD